MANNKSPQTVVLPDAGPLITLAYADALDVLFTPAWTVMLVDLVLHEVTRNQTPTSTKISEWVQSKKIPVLQSKTNERYQLARANNTGTPRKSNLGELAIQEILNDFAFEQPIKTGIFLFEDHKIARTSFLIPNNCHKISTLAFLLSLEQNGYIESASQIERRAVQAGRTFSSLRFPP
jgi:hypothetical protein